MLKLGRKQQHFYKFSRAKINISHGAVRSGKTFINNLRWLNYVRNGPPGTLLMSGRTKDSIRENVLVDLQAIVGDANFDYRSREGILHLYDRKIEVVGAEKVDAEARIRGRTYAGWYGDEVTIQHKAFVNQAIARCSIPQAQLFWTTNPDHPDHHIRKNFIMNEDMLASKQVRNWHFLLEDNATLTSDYIALLKNAYSGVFYDRNISGLWVLATGVVYRDSYSEPVHRISQDIVLKMLGENAFKEIIGGIDWGYTHPMVGLLIGVTHDNAYYLIDEFFQTEKQTEDIGAWFLNWEKRMLRKAQIIYCDSAEPDRIAKLRLMGLKVKGADKAINAGLNTVMTAFKNNRLFIAHTAENTHAELGKYRYPDPDDVANPEKNQAKDQPLDLDNHAMDALRYAIHNYNMYLEKLRPKRDKKLAII